MELNPEKSSSQSPLDGVRAELEQMLREASPEGGNTYPIGENLEMMRVRITQAGGNYEEEVRKITQKINAEREKK